MAEIDLLKATAAELQTLLASGELTSLHLVRLCHQQMIDHNDRLRAVISISPLEYTESVARQLDEERRRGLLRGPLHGIPLIVKAGSVSLRQATSDNDSSAGCVGHLRRISSPVFQWRLGI